MLVSGQIHSAVEGQESVDLHENDEIDENERENKASAMAATSEVNGELRASLSDI